MMRSLLQRSVHSAVRRRRIPTLSAISSPVERSTLLLSSYFPSSLLPFDSSLTIRSMSSKSAAKAALKGNVKPADAGRIVLHQSNIKKLKPGQVKLCSGCGTEVRRQGRSDEQISAHQIIAGVDAKDDTLSKKQSKRARYAEAASPSKGAFLCDRCRALQSDNIYRAYDALADVSPEVFSSQLRHIVGRRRFGLCLVVVDSTDPEHSAVKHLRRSIGPKTPVWLIFNKVDLVPRLDHRDQRILAMRVASLMDVKSFHNVFGVSAITGQGVPALAERLLQTLGGKDVFVVGCANVGKSTLVHQLSAVIATACYLKGKRGQTRRELCNNLAVTGSHLPGTTLQAVRIPCFASDRHALWDTPGIINSKAVQYALFPVHIMEPMARPDPIPMPSKEAGTQGHWRAGFSILIEAAWMDEEGVPGEEEVVRDLLKGQDAVSKEIAEANPAIAAILFDKKEEKKAPDSIVGKSMEKEEHRQNVVAVKEDKEDDDEDDEDDEDEENDDDEDEDEDEEDDDDEDEDEEDDDDEEDDEDEDDDDNDEEEEDHDHDDDEKDDDFDKESDDDDDDDNEFDKRRKAAMEKKRKVLEAAKERKRLREEQEAAKGKGNDKKSTATKQHKAPKNYNGPCVLGRIDLISVEDGHSVYAQAYLHPALRIRIVPTSEAPNHATVPTRHLNIIRKRMQEAAGKAGAVATKLKPEYSIPLMPYTAGLPNGELKPSQKEYNDAYSTYFMDVVFASLGWIAISHRGSFTLVPQCLEGSVFSKRPSLYPRNLATILESDRLNGQEPRDDPFTGMTEEQINDRLRNAAREGRHAGGSGVGPGEELRRASRYGGYSDDSFKYNGVTGDFYQEGDDADNDSMWY